MATFQPEPAHSAANLAVLVGAASVTVVPENDERRDILLTNASSAGMWVAYGPGSAVVGSGGYLAPSGELSDDTWPGEIQAIADRAGSFRLGIIEKSE